MPPLRDDRPGTPKRRAPRPAVVKGVLTSVDGSLWAVVDGPEGERVHRLDVARPVGLEAARTPAHVAAFGLALLSPN